MADIFNTHRPLLFSIAYRMLGSASDAEDVLQDAWLRYSSAEPGTVRSPKAFATTIVTRLCLDRLKSARATREEYVGPWLPEPVLTSEIAEVLGTTTESSRQLLHRAKARLAEGRPRLTGTAQSRRALAERFARAFSSGDGSELTALLAKDVGMWSDGGGKASAARRPLLGREAVLKFLIGLHRTAEAAGLTRDASLMIEDVNSEPALVLRVRQRLESIFVFTIDDNVITGIRVVRNPDKLARIDRQLTTLH